MKHYRWLEARSKEHLDLAQALRARCLYDELRLARRSPALVARDISELDLLVTSHHILVLRGDEPAATARLALPNPELARAIGSPLGLELELSFALDAFRHHAVAEVAKVFVSGNHRHTLALATLFRGMIELSRELHLDTWLGGVDCATSDESVASGMYATLLAEGRVHPELVATPKAGSVRLLPATKVCLAPAVRAFCRHLGASCVGLPSVHMNHQRQVLPFVAFPGQLAPVLARGS